MEEADYRTTYELEGDNWWFVGTRRICLDLLDGVCPPGRDARILDVGCGTGLMLDELAPRGRAVGVDVSATALDFCRLRSAPALLRADGGRLPVGDGEVDAVTAIGVIEHLDDDRAALEEWRRVLRPGGGLVLLTSAYQWMWSGHDVSNHHTRRYRSRDVRRLLEGTGFRPAVVSYVNTVLFPPIAVVRAAERLARRGRSPAPHKDTGEVPAPLNRALLGVLGLERRAIARRPLPFGVSIVASAVAA
ncbi:MAG: class I SAM-dependent methyltransferase [Acidimicrobiia bacterium]